jgi:Lanthionine synthetase C-like protein
MSTARQLPSDQPRSPLSPHKQLIASLQRLVRDFPPESVKPGGGLYYGPLSIAFLLFALSNHYPDLIISDMPLIFWSACYTDPIPNLAAQSSGPTPSECGVIDDTLSFLALNAASCKNPVAATHLCDYLNVVAHPSASNDWLHGRAGYLYLLRLVKRSFAHKPEILNLLTDASDYVIDLILASPRPWTWQGKVYVGAAHGIIGILTQVVLTNPDYAPRVEHHLDSLLQNQYDSGNWPATLPEGSERLVQFCHGAPGVVASLLSIRQHFLNLADRIDDAVAAGRELIREKGVLANKEPCLCHGATGNALALGEGDFETFLRLTTILDGRAAVLGVGESEAAVMEMSEHPESLWCGEAGRAWAWAVADLGRGGVKKFVGYNDI